MPQTITLRPGTPADAAACGSICYRAFATISQKHNFPPDLPSEDFTTGFLTLLLSRPDVYSVLAVRQPDDQIVGSNFLWEADPIAGVGPITVSPDAQDASVGRRLMEDVLARAASRRAPGVRLVQAGFHMRSLSLYTKLGFDVREPLVCMQGPPINQPVPGHPVRPATDADLPACNALCRQIHGHDRANELAHAISQRTATVVEHAGRITGYATDIGFFSHAVAATNPDLIALISAAPHFAGPGVLLPTRNAPLFRWALSQNLRATQPLTLMSLGLYTDPQGPFLPSILY